MKTRTYAAPMGINDMDKINEADTSLFPPNFGENTIDFHTSKDEGHLHHAELSNLAAMAQSIFHQVGATEVAHPELTTLVNFNGTNGGGAFGNLIADAHGDLFGTAGGDGPNSFGTVFEIAKTATGYASTPTTLVSFDLNFNLTEGYYPFGNLVVDARGDLFGVTLEGPNAEGTVFEIARIAPRGRRVECQWPSSP